MATQLQLRRGTQAQNDIFTGAEAELTYDTTNKGLRIHDGTTQGGLEVPVLVAVQRPSADNNYTWYRKYSDGWVEQGGIQIGNSTYGKATVNLPVEMADNTYQAFGNIGWPNETAWYTTTGSAPGQALITDVCGATTDKTTTTFSIQSFSTHNWYVCGMAA